MGARDWCISPREQRVRDLVRGAVERVGTAAIRAGLIDPQARADDPSEWTDVILATYASLLGSFGGLETQDASGWGVDAAMIRHASERLGGVEMPEGTTPLELAASYESLCGCGFTCEDRGGGLRLDRAGGRARRSGGVFYTPRALIVHMLDTALEPILQARLEDAKGKDPCETLLSIRVCDPSVGCGGFLAGVADRIARRIVDLGGLEYRHTLGEVVSRCVFGVDVDPVAVLLTRKVLGLLCACDGVRAPELDTRIVVGDGLVGARPGDLSSGLPDEAFLVVDGDDRARVTALRRQNAAERASQMVPRTPAQGRAEFGSVLDAWCAGFLFRDAWSRDVPPVTSGVIDRLLDEPCSVPEPVRGFVRDAATMRRFLHWEHRFPDVFSGSAPGFDLVIGNPPFLNQLESATVRSPGVDALIRWVTGGAVRGYTDHASAFLARSVDLVRSGGRVALVQPDSLLSAGQSRGVRDRVLDFCSLESAWISREHVFRGASVFVCVPVLVKGGARKGQVKLCAGSGFGDSGTVEIDMDELRGAESWGVLASVVQGVPRVEIACARTLGDIACATADFRDQYYGLDGFLVEGDLVNGDGEGTDRTSVDDDYPPIVTAGLIDPAVCWWGISRCRILKRVWNRPRIDLMKMDREGDLGSWVRARRVPKVLLATQTRVVESYVDHGGRFVPSIPLITITPRERESLWRIAAALSSPVICAVALSRYAGSALHTDAIKLSAKQVMRLPVPAPCQAWDRAADAFREASEMVHEEDRRALLIRGAELSCEAFDVPTDRRRALMAWWTGRLPSKS